MAKIDTLFMTKMEGKMAKIDTLFMTKTAEKLAVGAVGQVLKQYGKIFQFVNLFNDSFGVVWAELAYIKCLPQENHVGQVGFTCSADVVFTIFFRKATSF